MSEHHGKYTAAAAAAKRWAPAENGDKARKGAGEVLAAKQSPPRPGSRFVLEKRGEV
jgi:hypothetical protein